MTTSVFDPFIDPCDIHLPLDVTGELLRCATANGRISYEYLLAIYRCGVAAGREKTAALASPVWTREGEAPTLRKVVNALHAANMRLVQMGEEPMCVDLTDAERAALAASPAPAPEPLVALVERWQTSRRAVRDAEDFDTMGRAEQVLDVHENALLAWSRPTRQDCVRRLGEPR
jgi:hypothetical protein